MSARERLPALAESLSSAATGSAAIMQKIEGRARMTVWSLHGMPRQTVALLSGVHPATVQRWVTRFEAGGLLSDQPRSGRPRSFGEAARLRTIAVYCQKSPPLPGVHAWSLRAAEGYFRDHPEILGTSIARATINRILHEHALRPHRHKYYLQITDPDFFPKMERLLELYLVRPANLFCFDECTCIQAINRLTPDLPAAPGRPRREDFDYQRNGTTDLLAILNPTTGEVYGRCTPNHDRHTLSDFLRAHVATLPPNAVIHYVMDNLSSHQHDDFCQRVADLSSVPYTPIKTQAERREWLQSDHKRIVIHFTPFHASWLNMIEIWFGILKSKCLSFGHFRSVEHLKEDIDAFIQTWNTYFAHPFTWSYTGEGLHATVVRRFSRLLAVETDQMDSGFLRKQLLLMSNIAENYLGHEPELVPADDWRRLQSVAIEKDRYITAICLYGWLR